MAKVLVADDDKFLLSAYRVKLTKAGFEIRTATDGDEVLETLKKFIPDVIVLDLVMPKRDGFSALEAIKADPKLRSIPVLVASNLSQKEDIEKAKKLGANDYIVKADMPLSELVNKINSYIKQ